MWRLLLGDISGLGSLLWRSVDPATLFALGSSIFSGFFGGKKGQKAGPTEKPIYAWNEQQRNQMGQMGQNYLFPGMRGGMQNILDAQQGGGWWNQGGGGGGGKGGGLGGVLGAADKYWGKAEIPEFDIEGWSDEKWQNMLSRRYGNVRAQMGESQRTMSEDMARRGITGPKAAALMQRNVTQPGQQSMHDLTGQLMEYNWDARQRQREIAQQSYGDAARIALQKGQSAGGWADSAAARRAAASQADAARRMQMFQWSSMAPLDYLSGMTGAMGPQAMQGWQQKTPGNRWQSGAGAGLGFLSNNWDRFRGGGGIQTA